jgi:diaminohydroxyphosphoribosylaminopyrimidine deaminase/5-amino-6-(5-phosphoribosylamino)uracil reductase
MAHPHGQSPHDAPVRPVAGRDQAPDARDHAVPVRALMERCVRAALRAEGNVEPNPLVGAAIWRDGRVLAIGHHRRFGQVHAERDALDAARRAGHDVRGATMVVTLEPCNHHGKQPPCVDAIVSAGIARVIFARADPNPLARGGADALRARGVACEERHDCVPACRLADPFVHRILTGLPWVVCKWAQTIDGRVATRLGESKWISGERARARVHRLRGRVDAIVTGIGTVAADDPLLTARGVTVRRRALRVVADSDLSIPLDARVLQTASEAPTAIAFDRDLMGASIAEEKREAVRSSGARLVPVPTAPGVGARGLDLRALLRALALDHAVHTALVEAGPGMIGSLLEHDLVDEAVVYIAPMMLGDELARSVAVGRVAETLRHATRFDLMRVRNLSGDVELTYRRRFHMQEPVAPR